MHRSIPDHITKLAQLLFLVCRYTPLVPVPVQAGDIVGIYQPHTSSSRLRVFMQADGPVNYYRGARFSPLSSMSADGQSERRLPLIRFQFSKCGAMFVARENADLDILLHQVLQLLQSL